jgi:hypothetical protein
VFAAAALATERGGNLGYDKDKDYHSHYDDDDGDGGGSEDKEPLLLRLAGSGTLAKYSSSFPVPVVLVCRSGHRHWRAGCAGLDNRLPFAGFWRKRFSII